jgi:hypothetical protein
MPVGSKLTTLGKVPCGSTTATEDCETPTTCSLSNQEYSDAFSCCPVGKECSWGPQQVWPWKYGTTGTKCLSSEGYTGVLCAECRSDPGDNGLGFSFTGAGCVKCVPFGESSRGSLISFFVLIFLILWELSGAVAHCRTKQMAADSQTVSMLMRKKKILERTAMCVKDVMSIVGFGQQLAMLRLNLKIEFPNEFVELSNALSFLNLDLMNVMSTLCWIDGSYYLTLQFTFWLTTLVVLIFVLDYCRSRKMHPDDDTAGIFQIKALVMTFFTLYPQCAHVFLTFLLCREVDGRHYMQMDYSQHCYDDKWSSYAAIAIPGILVYVIGSPAFFLSILRSMAKSDTLLHPINADKFSFLYVFYKADYYWFEIYQMLVKCINCAIITFIWKGSATQVAVSLFFAIIFSYVAITVAPFKNMDLNANLRLTATTLVFTLFSSLVIKARIWELDGWDKGVADGFLMAVNFVAMLVFIYRFFRVQGNFLCEMYFPKSCQTCFLNFNRMMGWKPMPEPPPEPESIEGDGMPLGLLSSSEGGRERKPADYWQQTFKVVS